MAVLSPFNFLSFNDFPIKITYHFLVLLLLVTPHSILPCYISLYNKYWKNCTVHVVPCYDNVQPDQVRQSLNLTICKLHRVRKRLYPLFIYFFEKGTIFFEHLVYSSSQLTGYILASAKYYSCLTSSIFKRA